LAPDEFEKNITQNKAQSIFLSKFKTELILGKRSPKNLGYFCDKKLPNVNNHTMGENSTQSADPGHELSIEHG
jgi:hypothetical protein